MDQGESPGDETVRKRFIRLEGRALYDHVRRRLAADGLAQRLQGLHARIIRRNQVREVGVDAQLTSEIEPDRREQNRQEDDRPRVADGHADRGSKDVEKSTHWIQVSKCGSAGPRGHLARMPGEGLFDKLDVVEVNLADRLRVVRIAPERNRKRPVRRPASEHLLIILYDVAPDRYPSADAV